MTFRFPAASALLLLSLSLAACATPPADTAPAPQASPKVTIDSDATGTVITGYAQDAGAIEETDEAALQRRWRLVTRVTNGQVDRQLLVTLGYPGEARGYTRATIKGRTAGVQHLENAEDICHGGCTTLEALAVNIDGSTLYNAVNSGFDVKLMPQSGKAITIPVAAKMAWAQVMAEDQVLPQDAQPAAPEPVKKKTAKKKARK